MQVEGKAVSIDLVEGEHRVLKIEAAEGPDPTEPGWALPRQFLVRVVKVVDGAALLEYGPASHHSAVEA